MVSLEEEALILEKMKASSIYNLSAYLRKMAIDGFVIHLDMNPIHEMISLLRYSSNNLNQLAKKCNAHQPLALHDLDSLQEQLGEVWQLLRTLLEQFASMPK